MAKAKKGLDETTHRLASLRKKLIRRYDVEDLHDLRIALRRLRTYLKRRPGSAASALRKELGRLADATGDARDWDTLVERAKSDLQPAEMLLLEAVLNDRCAEAHADVAAMLRSKKWSKAMTRWRHYRKKHSKSATKDRRELDHYCRQVQRAFERARSTGLPREQHQLRIAVKELRYSLDSRPRHKWPELAEPILQQCKVLQGCLGTWHDTIVHCHLADELLDAFDEVDGERERQVLSDWSAAMVREGEACLAEAMIILGADQDNPIVMGLKTP